MKPRFRSGMTLIEVLAVVVILGMLAATLAVSFAGSLGKGKHELAKTGLGVVTTKLEAYYLDHGSFPPQDLGLEALSDGRAPPTATYYLAPGQLRDPWGNAYVLIVPGPDGHPYEVVSFGADGRPGGDGENEDLTSVSLRNGT